MVLPVERHGGSSGESRGASQFSGGGAPAAIGSDIYMGATRQRLGRLTPQARANAIGSGGGRSVDQWMSKEEALGDYFTWSDKKQNDFIAQGVIGGQLQLGDGPLEGAALWEKLITASELYGRFGKKVSPFDLLRRYVKQAGGTGGTWVREGDWEINTVTGERRYVGPRFKTTTDSRVDLTDPDTARAIATSLFQDMMGRDPRAGELGAFAKALHSAESANPVVQTTTTEFDLGTGEAIGTDSISEGGLTDAARGMIGQNQVKKKEEYGAYQAATTYYDALMAEVFGGPG